jgi:predicted permease
VIVVVAGLLAGIGAGVGAEARWGDGAKAATGRLLSALIYTVLPFMTFCAVSQLELTAGVGLGLAVGWASIATVGVGAYLVGDRLLRLPRASTGSLIAATVVSNTGYFGLPLTAALLGGAALAPAIAFDALVSTPSTLALGFAVGAAFGTKAGDTPRERLRAYLVRNPPLLALVAGLLVPASAVPEVLVDAARLAAFALLPVGFFILGVHLRAERAGGALSFPPPLTRGLVAALGLRLAVAPAVMLAATLVIGGIPPAYLLQAAAPCGINCLVIGHLFGLDMRLAAGAVFWSTALVLLAACATAVV